MRNNNNGIIRCVTDDDWPMIYNLIERVFLRKDEALFMKDLNENQDLVYTAVLERNKDINGLVAYSRLKLTHNNQVHDALVMAPLLIDPIWQGKGCGSDLIETSHVALRNAGEKLVFVLGEEKYYSRFGYSQEAAAPYQSPYSGPFLLAAKWSDDIPETGAVSYPPAFAKVIG